jgi:hypothetical protein
VVGTTTTAAKAASIHRVLTGRARRCTARICETLTDAVKIDVMKRDKAATVLALIGKRRPTLAVGQALIFKTVSVLLCTTITAMSTGLDVAHPACRENTMAACLRAKFVTTAWASAWLRP